MKIHELVKSKILSEGQVDPNVMLSVKNILSRGKANNHFEFLVLSRLLQMVKNGSFYRENNFLDPFLSTSGEMMSCLRAMPADQIVSLASFLLKLLNVKDEASYNSAGYMSYCDPSCSMLPWLQRCMASEASD